MRKFFAITLCLLVSTSVFAAAPRRQGRSDLTTAKIVIATAIHLLQWRIGIIPNGDGLTPPWPKPGEKPTTCCK